MTAFDTIERIDRMAHPPFTPIIPDEPLGTRLLTALDGIRVSARNMLPYIPIYRRNGFYTKDATPFVIQTLHPRQRDARISLLVWADGIRPSRAIISSARIPINNGQYCDILGISAHLERNARPAHMQRLSSLEKWSQFRTTDWINYLEYPELTNKEVSRLLSIYS